MTRDTFWGRRGKRQSEGGALAFAITALEQFCAMQSHGTQPWGRLARVGGGQGRLYASLRSPSRSGWRERPATGSSSRPWVNVGKEDPGGAGTAGRWEPRENRATCR